MGDRGLFSEWFASSKFSFDYYQFSVMHIKVLHNCFRESGYVLEELKSTTMKVDQNSGLRPIGILSHNVNRMPAVTSFRTLHVCIMYVCVCACYIFGLCM